MRLGLRSGDGQLVSVSAPAHCRCDELELDVLQNRGIPCARGDSSCSWMTAHASGRPENHTASFRVPVGGWFRPRALCQPPRFVAERRRLGRRPSYLLFDGEPRQMNGIDLRSWNVSLAASTRDDHLEVRVVRQMDAGGSGVHFPELFVTLYRPPSEPRWPLQRVAQHRVQASDEQGGATVLFQNAALGRLYGWRVDVRPARSWVCVGANDGCQKRYAMVEELLELAERTRANAGTEA